MAMFLLAINKNRGMTLPHHNHGYLCNLFLKVGWFDGGVEVAPYARADLWVAKSVPQRLKPSSSELFAARLKPCPSSRVFPNRLRRDIKGLWQ
jgi:hypothetical protein